MLITFLMFMVLLVVVAYVAITYNSLVALKHNVSKAWANIDVILKQRHDELPKLIETCKQYMKFEQETLTKVIEARSKVFSARETRSVAGLGAAEGMLSMALGTLFALSEAYPDLKANASFQQLQARMSQLEETISSRREFYNESVNLNNVAIEQFPQSIIARQFGFAAHELLKFSENERADVDVKSTFN